MKRIFIAVKIESSDTLRSMVSELKVTLKDEKIKWTDPENFHITVAFLGDTAEDKIKAVGEMLKMVCAGFGEFGMIVKGAGVFKNIDDPRVLWTGIEPSEKLITLFKSVKAGLKDAGISVEDRNFNPHLTLGRIKRIKNKDLLKSIIFKYRTGSIQKQQVTEVILYESLLFPPGPVYKPLGIYHLA